MAKMAVINYLTMFSCGSPVRAKNRTLALGAAVLISQSLERWNLQYFQPDRLTGLVLWQVDSRDGQKMIRDSDYHRHIGCGDDLVVS